MKLTWSAFAMSNRDTISTYVEADNPAAAVLIDKRIVAAARRLLDFSASGRMRRIDGTRELVIHGTPYLAPYAIIETTVRILRVLHGAQEWPVHGTSTA